MVLFLTACSNGSVENGFTYEKTIKQDQSVVVGELEQSQWELTLNKDAFEEDVKLTMSVFSKEDTEAIAGSFQLFNAPVSLSIEDATNVRLATPATIKVNLPQDYTGPYASLFMGYLTPNGWEYFTPDYIDLETGVAYSTIQHFSGYAFGVPSEQEQIDTYAKKVATEQWLRTNEHSALLDATKNQYNDMFLSMGIANSQVRNQFVADMVSFLEEATFDTNGTSPIDALAQMANAASQGEAGKQAFMEKFVEFTGKAMLHTLEQDPGEYSKVFNSVLSLQKIATALSDGEDEDALRGLASLLKAQVPQAQLVETVLVFAVDKARQSIEYWTAEEIEKAYQAYTGNAQGKYGFADSTDFDLIFTTLGGGQRMHEIRIIEQWCAARKIDPNTLGQSARDRIVKDAYTALKANFDLRKVKEPEVMAIQTQEQALIAAMIKEGLMDPNQYKQSYGNTNVFNPTQRLEQLYRLKNTILNMLDPELAKSLTPQQIATILRQWMYYTEKNDRKGFYQYLKDSNYLRKAGGEAEYAWVYIESVTYDGQTQIDSTNANGAYSASGTAAPGSYSYTWSYLGATDTYYDPDLINGEGATVKGTSSTPPTLIRGGEVITLTLSIEVAEDNLSYFTTNGAISADIDAFDVAPGYSTNAYDDFVNKDGKSTFIVDTYKTRLITSTSDTVTATMPNGNEEGEKLAIRVQFSSSAIMGTNYIYEWKAVE